jgi:Xaa-Pro aminopeptidase
VEARVFEAFRSKGASPAFATIVGGGLRGTVLHYEDNRCRLAAGETVVVDVGARFGHYCGDLTRTYPVGASFTPRQREIYALVLEANRHAVRSFVSGSDTLLTMRDRCREFLRASPLRARDASGAEQTMDVFMPHGISHFLGLDVHDVGEPDQTLPPGSVITVEPGIYIPREEIAVRIEDDYLVSADGLELLGPPLEEDSGEVEAAMRSAGARK